MKKIHLLGAVCVVVVLGAVMSGCGYSKNYKNNQIYHDSETNIHGDTVNTDDLNNKP
ncbi:MAG: hypothetical protein JO317_06120 [Verrucomicrobiae bacterium]|nr:hypothetical protein [Verrucomicrobiae bacterium]